MTEKTVSQLAKELGVARQTILYRINALEIKAEKNRKGAFVLNEKQVQAIIDNFNGSNQAPTHDKQNNDQDQQKSSKQQTKETKAPQEPLQADNTSDMVQISKTELEILNSVINDLKEDKKFLQKQLQDMTVLSDSLKTLTDQQQQLNLKQLGISENRKEVITDSDTKEKQSLWDRLRGK